MRASSQRKVWRLAKIPTSAAKYAAEMGHPFRVALLSSLLVLCCFAVGQNAKSGPKADLNGNYEGTAKNAAGEVIKVTFELSEKQGTVSGMIRSDHGDFAITGGKQEGSAVTLEFDAGGTAGTITLKLSDDTLSGTWSAGDDGGPVEVKKVAGKETPKEKS
ncbi:MAG TPA: hypothetical protein VGS27_16020 [Candidatus Sulfotelmatobacter sp.]|nr:hypothetical protein [Candidatus Sulfotelmatobacter sp.]